MIRSMGQLCLTSAFAMSLLACSSGSKKESEENPNVFPSDYKNEILNTMTNSLDDPTNVRSAYISEPALRPAGREQRYMVCVRSDSRDLARQYTGIKDRVAIFYGGHLTQLIDATKEQCGSVAYKPFPELENLCQAKKCV